MQDRVALERMVFEYQYGASETGTGSANSVFFVEAYVNFGVAGLLVTAFLVGAVLKYVGRSEDPALRCMAPLIVYSVFFGSFFSTLFSNGLLLLLLLRPALHMLARPIHRRPNGDCRVSRSSAKIHRGAS